MQRPFTKHTEAISSTILKFPGAVRSAVGWLLMRMPAPRHLHAHAYALANRPRPAMGVRCGVPWAVAGKPSGTRARAAAGHLGRNGVVNGRGSARIWAVEAPFAIARSCRKFPSPHRQTQRGRRPIRTDAAQPPPVPSFNTPYGKYASWPRLCPAAIEGARRCCSYLPGAFSAEGRARSNGKDKPCS